MHETLSMEKKIAIIGLGYVGLPLAVEFAKQYPTVGYDINSLRVEDLMNCRDRTLEIGEGDLMEVINSDLNSTKFKCKGLYCTTKLAHIASSNFYVITVPTPTDKNKHPELTPLIRATQSVGKVLKKNDYVIYESTVYPGVTEDDCVPVLEQVSGLTYNKDFFVGYSPERFNPADKERSIKSIVKVTSGSTAKAAQTIDELYKSVISAGTYLAPSIRVAEASKVVENSQRDINIAFVNELAKIFNKMDIDTHSVLEAAGTKWNFLPFKPGLVGGNCIGVDPYYLAQKAKELGCNPEVILSGRRRNNEMGKYVATELTRLMIKSSLPVSGSNILMLGITFKENCPDIRNTLAIDVYNELKSQDINVDVHDPWADENEVKNFFGFSLSKNLNGKKYHGIILTVAHSQYSEIDFRSQLVEGGVLYDVQGILPLNQVDARL